MGKIWKTLSHNCQSRCRSSSSNSRVQNFNLGTFLKKISDIFPFACKLISSIFFPLRKSYRWYMCFMSDETEVILAVVPKPIWPKAECIFYIRKKQGFFFSSYCFLMSLHQIYPYSFLRTFFSMFSWYHFRNTLLEPLSPQRFVTGILTENYLLVFLVLWRYTNPVDHHLPALCPPWVGDSWLVIVRHYYGYYFHFKQCWRHILQCHRRKGIFRQMHTSCW